MTNRFPKSQAITDTKWTPGPWRVSSPDPHLFPSVIFHDRAPGSRPAMVCINEGSELEARARGEYHGTTMETARATATLIAAAPELFDALRELLRQIADNDFKDSHGHEAIRLRAYAEAQHALVKATKP